VFDDLVFEVLIVENQALFKVIKNIGRRFPS
jgi:hypothetical protein